MKTVNPDSYTILCRSIANYILSNPEIEYIYGIPQGGVIAAYEIIQLIQDEYPSRKIKLVKYHPGTQLIPINNILVVDDIIDSGNTIRPFIEEGFRVACLILRARCPQSIKTFIEYSGSICADSNNWIELWTDNIKTPEDAVIRLLEYIGEDPKRQGLIDTPRRVCNSLKELTNGYSIKDPGSILVKQFNSSYDEMIVLKDIHFTSLCEHHLLPFYGTVSIGYIPRNGCVFGISKLPRVVKCYAERLQIQERLVDNIALCIADKLGENPNVAVIAKAHHECMSCRGVKVNSNTNMITSKLIGKFKEQPETRAEFLNLVS